VSIPVAGILMLLGIVERQIVNRIDKPKEVQPL
jgi:hypothetical protein